MKKILKIRKKQRFGYQILIIILLLMSTLILSSCDMECSHCEGSGRIRIGTGAFATTIQCPRCAGSGEASVRIGWYAVPWWLVFVVIGIIVFCSAISSSVKDEKDKKIEALLKRQTELLEEQTRTQNRQAPDDTLYSEKSSEEKTEFTVVMSSFGDEKVKVIKEVRTITGLGLAKAKALVESAPANIKEGVNKDEAEDIKQKLTVAGATVELK